MACTYNPDDTISINYSINGELNFSHRTYLDGRIFESKTYSSAIYAEFRSPIRKDIITRRMEYGDRGLVSSVYDEDTLVGNDSWHLKSTYTYEFINDRLYKAYKNDKLLITIPPECFE